MFKERNTKFALLSLLALVVVSTAFAGVSIYAQTDDSELTTFEEEAIEAGTEMEDSGLEDEDTAMSDDNATSDDTANETETAADDETSTASTDCIVTISSDNETSTSGNATDATNATSTASNATSASISNATGINATSTEPLDMSNATSTAETADCATVTLTPVEQNVGGTVLVNVTGLAESTNVTIMAGDLVAGYTESDENGNLLYALGISDEMTSSLTVTVEDGEGNIGSAVLTITGSQEEQAVPEENAPSNQTSTASDLTASDTGETGTAGEMLDSNDESSASPKTDTSSNYEVQ